jgi:hypothetical protein
VSKLFRIINIIFGISSLSVIAVNLKDPINPSPALIFYSSRDPKKIYTTI